MIKSVAGGWAKTVTEQSNGITNSKLQNLSVLGVFLQVFMCASNSIF